MLHLLPLPLENSQLEIQNEWAEDKQMNHALWVCNRFKDICPLKSFHKLLNRDLSVVLRDGESL